MLKSLSLELAEIEDEGAKALASALRVNKVLETLDLGFNRIGDVGAGALANALLVKAEAKLQRHRFSGLRDPRLDSSRE